MTGPNFVFDEYTGENCDVAPYSEEYKPITDVPIVDASTAYTNPETGETLILRFNHVLWYGKKMQMRLINPNQMRHYGLIVLDDPTNYDRAFGITCHEVTVPFDMIGTTVFFTSRAPTRWEQESCPIIEMTKDSQWNPSEVHLQKSYNKPGDFNNA